MFLRGGKTTRKRHIDIEVSMQARLSVEEIAERVEALRDNYSIDARNELVGRLLPVAVDVASRYAYHFSSLSHDLVSIAFLELTRVIDAIAGGKCDHDGYIEYIANAISGRCARAIEKARRTISVPYAAVQNDETREKLPTCSVGIAVVAHRPAKTSGLPDPVEAYIAAAHLTPEEATLVAMRLDGILFGDIATAMGITTWTLKQHRDSAQAKMTRVLYP